MLGPCVLLVIVDGVTLVVDTDPDRSVAYATLLRQFRMLKGTKRRKSEPVRRVVGELWQTWTDGSPSSIVCRINGPAPDLPGVKTSTFPGMTDVLVSFVE